MAIYLVKFILCSGLLLLAYQLLLKNKTTYQFNRAYLLLSLVFSLTIPLATVERSVSTIFSAHPVNAKLKAFSEDEPPAVKNAYPISIARNEAVNKPQFLLNYKLYITAPFKAFYNNALHAR